MEKIIKFLLSGKFIGSAVVIIIVVAMCIAIHHIKEKYKKTQSNSSNERSTAVRILISALRFVVVLIGVFAILQVNGVNITGMMAGLGIISAIIGLALQDLLKDIIMGVNIVVDHFFSVGEVVSYGGREGVIVSVTLRTTKVGDLDDHSITTICNRNISEIRRFSKRLDLDIPLAYGADVQTVRTALDDICAEVTALEHVEKCSYEGIQLFDSSSIQYRLLIFCDPTKRADVRRAANIRIQACLAKAGLEIPFNQLDVHFDK